MFFLFKLTQKFFLNRWDIFLRLYVCIFDLLSSCHKLFEYYILRINRLMASSISLLRMKNKGRNPAIRSWEWCCPPLEYHEYPSGDCNQWAERLNQNVSYFIFVRSTLAAFKKSLFQQNLYSMPSTCSCIKNTQQQTSLINK